MAKKMIRQCEDHPLGHAILARSNTVYLKEENKIISSVEKLNVVDGSSRDN